MNLQVQDPTATKDERITSEHAVIVKEIPNHNCLMDYVRGVAAVVGSNNIYGIYKDKGYVKIYLKDKKYVEAVVNSGIVVLGHHANVEFAVPRASKIVLTNIDPAIPDSDVKNLLSAYGTLESDVIHERISNAVEYSHIYCGVRYVYMSLFDKNSFPRKLNWMRGSSWNSVDVVVEEQIEEKVDTELMDIATTADDVNGHKDPSPEPERKSLRKSVPTARQLAYRNRGKMLGRGFRKRGSRWAGYITTSKSTAKSIAANHIRKHARQYRQKRGRRGRSKPLNSVESRLSSDSKQASSVDELDRSGSPEARSESVADSVIDEVENSQSICMKNADDSPKFKLDVKYPLSLTKLEKFLHEVKHHRNPLEVAKLYLSENGTPDALNDLIHQLNECHKVCNDHNMKLRIFRLVNVLE